MNQLATLALIALSSGYVVLIVRIVFSGNQKGEAMNQKEVNSEELDIPIEKGRHMIETGGTYKSPVYVSDRNEAWREIANWQDQTKPRYWVGTFPGLNADKFYTDDRMVAVRRFKSLCKQGMFVEIRMIDRHTNQHTTA